MNVFAAAFPWREFKFCRVHVLVRIEERVVGETPIGILEFRVRPELIGALLDRAAKHLEHCVELVLERRAEDGRRVSFAFRCCFFCHDSTLIENLASGHPLSSEMRLPAAIIVRKVGPIKRVLIE